MKRVLTFLLAAMLCFGAATTASAVELNAKGDFHFSGVFWDNRGFSDSEADHYWFQQRTRVQLEFVAAENLKGVLYLRNSGNMRWGRDADGAALDANKKSLSIRMAYVDWTVPNTDLNLMIGIRRLTLPGAVAGTPVLDDAAATITLNNKFNDNVSASLIWARPYDTNDQPHNTTDLFILSVPMTFDSVKVNPWGLYGRDGSNGEAFGSGSGLGIADEHANIWFAGVAASVNVIEPLTLAGDFIYGAVTRSGSGFETSGWFADFKATYKFNNGALSGFAWYSSGDDEDDSTTKNESGRLPSFTSKPDTEQPWKISSFGAFGNAPLCGGAAISRTGIGTWGAGIAFERFSFVEDLFHTVRLLYWNGTNEKGSVRLANFGDTTYMNEDDSAIEVNFDHIYNINQNLEMRLDIGYIYMDWDDAAGREDYQWRTGLVLMYKF